MHLVLRILAAASALALAAAPGGAVELRQNPKVVIELFTSQGCASCIDADAKLAALAAQPDVIALAYHVDYWDYIGWADTFGMPANSKRQRDYAQSWGSGRLITPQLIINGLHGVVGSRPAAVDAAIAPATLDLPVGLAMTDSGLDVAIGPKSDAPRALVWLVTFKNHARVDIGSGENAGRTMDYTQIVTSRQLLGAFDSAAGTKLKLPLPGVMAGGANGGAIIVQEDKDGLPGAILGAASFTL